MSKYISDQWINGKINGIQIGHVACSSGNYETCSGRTVKYVVMHYTGNVKDTAAANCNYFRTSGRKASAHIFVDESHIIQSVKLKDRAWAVGAKSYVHPYCRNENSISIEMCTSGNSRVSSKTKNNAAYVCAYMCKKLGISASQVDTYVLRHYDCTMKSCPQQMCGSNNKEWIDFKSQVKKILNGQVKVKSNTAPKFEVGKVYKLRTDLKLRTAASKDADVKLKKDLSAYTQKCCTSAKEATLKATTEITCKSIKTGEDGSVFVRCASGWLLAWNKETKYVNII